MQLYALVPGTVQLGIGPLWSYATVWLGPRSNTTVWLGPLWSHATVGLGPWSNATGDRAPVEPCSCVARSPVELRQLCGSVPRAMQLGRGPLWSHATVWLGPLWRHASVGLGPRSDATLGIGPRSNATVGIGPLHSHATMGLGTRSNATWDRAPVEPCNCVARSPEQCNWG